VTLLDVSTTEPSDLTLMRTSAQVVKTSMSPLTVLLRTTLTWKIVLYRLINYIKVLLIEVTTLFTYIKAPSQNKSRDNTACPEHFGWRVRFIAVFKVKIRFAFGHLLV